MAKAHSIGGNLFLPDLGDLIFLGLLYLLLYVKPNYLFSDASIGWHILAGNYIVEHHIVPSQDLFSYTFPTKAWLDYEWLFHVIMSYLMKLGGLNLLGVVVAGAIGYLFLLLYEKCRKEDLHFLLAVALCLIGEIASSVHWLARPHLITFFGVYLFYVTLEDFYQCKIKIGKLLSSIVLYMLFWTNCHPGFLFGLGILLIYVFSSAIVHLALEQDELSKQASRKRLEGLLLCLVLSATVTLINPYAFRLYLYIANYLQQRAVLAVTNEFKSPVFHADIQSLCLEILFGMLICGLAIRRKSISLPVLLTTLMLAHFSLASVRNIPLFVIVSLPLISRLLAATRVSASDSHENTPAYWNHNAEKLVKAFNSLNAKFTDIESNCKAHVWPKIAFLLLCAVAVTGGKVLGRQVLNIGFSQSSVPSGTLAAIKTLKLDPHKGFNFDNWGGYIAYKLGIPVFIDDRADFYGDLFYLDYGLICETAPNWMSILDKYHIDWVIFPSKSNLTLALKEKPDWQLVASDEASSLLIRSTLKRQGK